MVAGVHCLKTAILFIDVGNDGLFQIVDGFIDLHLKIFDINTLRAVVDPCFFFGISVIISCHTFMRRRLFGIGFGEKTRINWIASTITLVEQILDF